MRTSQLLLLPTLIFSFTQACQYLLAWLPAHAEPLTTVATVSDTKALGYPSNHHMLIDAGGTEYFAVRTRDAGNQFNIGIFQSVSGGYDRIWLLDESVSHPPQRAASITLVGSEIHTVWYGSRDPQQPWHQIQFARVQTGTPMSILENSTPFNVLCPTKCTSNASLWQEHPAAVADGSGNLHVVWEGRDESCLNPTTGNPVPGIAYVRRSAAAGGWSDIGGNPVSGDLTKPPYLIDECTSRSRPIPLLDVGGSLHLLAYGTVPGVSGSRVLYGNISLSSGTFTGWTQVVPSVGSVNQKNVSAVIDSAGAIHVAWREGPHFSSPTGCPPQLDPEVSQVVIKYSSRVPSGVWSAAVVISDPAHYSSTPSVAVNGSTVQVAYVGWAKGTLNRDQVIDNCYPSDTGTVEGSLYVADNSAGGWVEYNVEAVDSVSAYPTWKNDSNQLLWTSAAPSCADSRTQADDCVRLNRGVYGAGTIQ